METEEKKLSRLALVALVLLALLVVGVIGYSYGVSKAESEQFRRLLDDSRHTREVIERRLDLQERGVIPIR